MINLFFIPHQDDEVLTFGVKIIQECLSSNSEVHVILCTDGSASAVRKILCNWHRCGLHKSLHHYRLSLEKFIEARDKEFIASCGQLGVCPQNIHILDNRSADGKLSVDIAQNIIKNAIGKYSLTDQFTVHTFFPSEHNQAIDHRNLGLAALNLQKQGVIRNLNLFLDPHCLEDNQQIEFFDFVEIKCFDDEEKKKIISAKNEYGIWDPKRGRYAIGLHSVPDLFYKTNDCARIKAVCEGKIWEHNLKKII